MKPIRIYILLLPALVWLAACGPKKPVKNPPKNDTQHTIADTGHTVNLVTAPGFSADSAYGFIEKQLSFGPRVPNTKGHKACGDYLIATFKRFGAKVIVQEATVNAYTGAGLKIRNIIAQYKPEATNRIVLFAHWDTRPFADNDPEDRRNKPIPGADDGGSGVAVLLEIARNLQAQPPAIGVDLILFDGEDYGNAEGAPETYCLGSQYWAKNQPIPGYYAKYGILLDMVGGANARFCREGWSRQYASSVVDNIWNTAQALGYGMYFVMKDQSPVTDDHYFVNTLARIPTVDIINFDTGNGAKGFPEHWHTSKDDISAIDKNVLKAVGQTLMQVIYSEQ